METNNPNRLTRFGIWCVALNYLLLDRQTKIINMKIDTQHRTARLAWNVVLFVCLTIMSINKWVCEREQPTNEATTHNERTNQEICILVAGLLLLAEYTSTAERRDTIFSSNGNHKEQENKPTIKPMLPIHKRTLTRSHTHKFVFNVRLKIHRHAKMITSLWKYYSTMKKKPSHFFHSLASSNVIFASSFSNRFHSSIVAVLFTHTYAMRARMSAFMHFWTLMSSKHRCNCVRFQSIMYTQFSLSLDACMRDFKICDAEHFPRTSRSITQQQTHIAYTWHPQSKTAFFRYCFTYYFWSLYVFNMFWNA